MRRGVEQGVVGLERRLRAVAVMDVEIDDRHAFETVHIAGPQGADRGVVEQAETHRPVGFGMMPGRAHRAECVVGLARRRPRRRRRSPRRRRATPPGPRPATAPCRRRSRHGPPSERHSGRARHGGADALAAHRRSPPPAPRAARDRQIGGRRAPPAPRAAVPAIRDDGSPDRARDRPNGYRAGSSSPALASKPRRVLHIHVGRQHPFRERRSHARGSAMA